LADAAQQAAALEERQHGDALVGREPSPLTPLVQQLLPLLRSERQGAPGVVMVDADRVLRRLGGTVPPEVRQLIGLLIQGREESLASTLASSAGLLLAKSPDAMAEVSDLPSIASKCQEVVTSTVVLPEEEEFSDVWTLMVVILLLAVME
jgi:hypothetical protein